MPADRLPGAFPWRAAFWAGVAVLVTASLLPGGGMLGADAPGQFGLAKHPAAYFVLASVGLRAWRRGTPVAAGLVLLGVAIELLQGALPDSFERSMSAGDVAGNVVGVAAAWAAALAWARRRRAA